MTHASDGLPWPVVAVITAVTLAVMFGWPFLARARRKAAGRVRVLPMREPSPPLPQARGTHPYAGGVVTFGAPNDPGTSPE
jgi:hypothetical protein